MSSMNRPANMTPAPGLGSGNTSFRPPYPPNLASQAGQATQNPYGPPRGTANGRSNYHFPGQQQLDDPQRQSRTALQQQQQAMQQHLQQLSMSQHSQTAAASSTSLPLQSSQGSGLANQDLRDFPALGSSAMNAPNPLASTNGNTYAAQAGTAVGASNTGNPSTGFGPDDFPALGQAQGDIHSTGPHGLAGPSNGQELGHRSSLLGGVPTTQQRATPSSEAQQRQQLAQQYQNQMLKGYAQKDGKSASNPALAPNQYNWSQQPQGAPQSSHSNIAPDLLASHPPPGMGPGSQGAGNIQSTQQGQSQPQQPQDPSQNSAVTQVPVQQVLASPADRWGLLGFLNLLRSKDPDTAMMGVGTDLSLAGFELQTHEPIYPSFITPWSDASAVQTIEPDFHVPNVYNVHPPVPGPNKAGSFSDETLFFMFYSTPRDVLQEVAAQELHNRNWRFHKEGHMWLTKESGTAPSQKGPNFERGVYTFFDPDSWERVKKDVVVMYDALEERAPLNGPVNIGGPIPQNGPAPSHPPPGMGMLGQGHQQLSQQSQASHLNQAQAAHSNAHQQQLHQQQQLEQLRMQQSMNARYQGTRTPGLGGM
ncbi:hypothetical protein DL93DRAFT_834752 [Clavulina sp. PMI_390]|nr:hypothetical protein DL93DRAFT_834752 [Clavulina sp. PMI_390]